MPSSSHRSALSMHPFNSKKRRRSSSSQVKSGPLPLHDVDRSDDAPAGLGPDNPRKNRVGVSGAVPVEVDADALAELEGRLHILDVRIAGDLPLTAFRRVDLPSRMSVAPHQAPGDADAIVG